MYYLSLWSSKLQSVQLMRSHRLRRPNGFVHRIVMSVFTCKNGRAWMHELNTLRRKEQYTIHYFTFCVVNRDQAKHSKFIHHLMWKKSAKNAFTNFPKLGRLISWMSLKETQEIWYFQTLPVLQYDSQIVTVDSVNDSKVEQTHPIFLVGKPIESTAFWLRKRIFNK